MFLIGVISGKDYEKVEKELYKRLSEKEYNIIDINSKVLQSLKNIKFDLILVTKKLNITSENEELLKKIINNTNYLVINTDTNKNLNILEKSNLNLITYGFNSKTTITASSINTDSMQVCIQRNIKTLNNKIIEQQDRKIDIKVQYNASILLGIYTILIIFEKN